MNLKQIEKMLIDHIEESGYIRSDLAWLKKAHWIQFGTMLTVVGTVLVAYLLKGH